MILADAAEQGANTASQAFFYIAIAVAVGYFGWQFYKGAKENGGGLNYGWFSGPRKGPGDESDAAEQTDESIEAAPSSDDAASDTTAPDADEDPTRK